MLRIGGATTIAGKEERAATTQRRLVPLGDRRIFLRLLRGDAASECGQTGERLPDLVDSSLHRAASTNASSPPSSLGSSSRTVPITTKSAPARPAARAFPGART